MDRILVSLSFLELVSCGHHPLSSCTRFDLAQLEHFSKYLLLCPTEERKCDVRASKRWKSPSKQEKRITFPCQSKDSLILPDVSLSLLLSVFDCMCHLLCSFTLFVYSSLFCLSSAHFLSFSSKLHLSPETNRFLPGLFVFLFRRFFCVELISSIPSSVRAFV